ncbi:MAG: hypothetical protein AAFY84_12785 [Pseudomonadota bacterium]
MADKEIKSAKEVVSDFLDSLAGNADLDAMTVKSIRFLRGDGKLTKTNLLRRLEADRAADAAPPAQEAGDDD